MHFQSLSDMNVEHKTILLRADLNVPAKNGNVTDFTRIDRLKDTIAYLTEKGAKTVVISHFGRPKGERKTEFSLSFLPPVLTERWGTNVSFADDCIGEPAHNAVNTMNAGDVLLLENLRFHAGEEKNDPAFAQELAKLGDIYVNDAFSAAHRAHASTEAITKLLPTAAGFLMDAELTALNNALENPEKPVCAIVGGAKISTKLELLNNLVQKVDKLVLGGGMANTFMYAQGMEVGLSLCEKDMKDEALKIMETAKTSGCDIILPSDRVIVKEFGENASHEIVDVTEIPADQEAIDIGPETIKMMEEILATCKTVLWNGPMGVFEVKPFDNGTNGLAQAVATLTSSGQLISVAGGGDTVSALENAGVTKDFTYISTAGGAFLEWLEGKTLPGVAALMDSQKAA